VMLSAQNLVDPFGDDPGGAHDPNR
jgi:hypothetical protein